MQRSRRQLKFGAADFLVSEPEPIGGAAPSTKRIALVYIDAVMTEIIEPDPGQLTIYDEALPSEQGAIRLHHLGYLIEEHDGMLTRLRSMGLEVPLHGTMPGALDYSYADTRAELGIFLSSSGSMRGDAHFSAPSRD